MKDQLEYIKPFLLFLNICPAAITNVGDDIIFYMANVISDQHITEALRKI
jgi:hypothetical protein